MFPRATLGLLCALVLSAQAVAADALVEPIQVEKGARVTIACPFEERADVIQVSLMGHRSHLLAEKLFCDVQPKDALEASFTFRSQRDQEVRCVVGQGEEEIETQGRLTANPVEPPEQKRKRAERPKRPRPDSPRIGLALSGGGFRAAAFHLGVMKRLDEFGLLDDVKAMSTVSGGSIAGAAVVLNWRKRDRRLELLDRYLRNESPAVPTILGGLLNPFRSRIDKLAGSYDRALFHEATIQDLQESNGPEMFINATNLGNGKYFSFFTGEPAKMGDYEAGVLQGKTPEFRVADAVAASSAFPPAYNPLKLKHEWYDPKYEKNGNGGSKYDYVTLTDGGVYDNLGTTPLLRKAQKEKMDYLIVSDGGMPFGASTRPTTSSVGALSKAIGIMGGRGRTADLAKLGALKEKAPPVPIWFSIDKPLKYASAAEKRCAGKAAGVETNLKALTPDEMRLLTGHGASLIEARLDYVAPELIGR